MAMVIIHALAPIFVIMLLGFMAGKTKMVDNTNVSLLNIFVMDFALPVALFSAIVKTPWSGIVQQAPMILGLALTMWIVYALIFFTGLKLFKKNPQDTAVLSLTVAFPNFAALGLPVLNSVMGEGTATSLSVAVCIATGSILLTPLCLLTLEKEKAKASGEQIGSTMQMLPILMWRSVKKPIVWGPMIGVILSALKFQMPDIALAAIKPLGLAATAGALFLTGVILSARKLKINVVVILGTIIKLVVQPFLAWGIASMLGLPDTMTATAVLMVALSGGFFGVVFGNRFGASSPDAEAILLLTSLLCILSLPLFMSLTAHLH